MSGGDDLFCLVGYQLEGKYAVEAAVARGGFGVVYRARHLVLKTQHAVKVLRVPPGLAPELHRRFLEQFVEEAQIIAQFEHPAVVRVTDFGVSSMPTGEDAPWMVLEWIEGQTLADNLTARRGQGGRTPRECFDLLQPVIDALAAAHEMGIAHRDIKPGNIMLSRDPSGGAPRSARRGANARPAARVLDFGIAKLMSEGEDGPVSGATRTQSLMPAYSPRYASPEQASGTRTGPWTDVHALALILTEMLTDRPPYDSTDKLRLTMQIMSPTRPTPARAGVDVGAWEAVLNKALSLPPGDRFANAGDFLAALEANIPATTGHPSTPPLHTPTPADPQIYGYTSTPGVSLPPPPDNSTLRPSTAPTSAQGSSSLSRTALGLALLFVAVMAGTVVILSKRTPDAASASPRAATPGAVAAPAPQPAQPVAPATPPIAVNQHAVVPGAAPSAALAPSPPAAPQAQPDETPAQPTPRTPAERVGRVAGRGGHHNRSPGLVTEHETSTQTVTAAPAPNPSAPSTTTPASERGLVE